MRPGNTSSEYVDWRQDDVRRQWHARDVDVPELLIGGLLGVLLGAFVRPLSARLERLARSVWRESPLLVHVEQDPAIIWVGTPDWVPFSVYFREVLHLPPPPDDRTEWLAWAKRQGGKDVFVTQLSVTMQAKTDVAVVVEGVRAKSRTRPVTEGYVVTRPTGGAGLSPRHFSVDLDWGPDPVVTFYGDGGEPAPVPTMRIAAGDIERFQIWAEASQGWHDWSLELLLLVEGRRMTVPINNNGAPFTTVGQEGLTHLSTGPSADEPWPT